MISYQRNSGWLVTASSPKLKSLGVSSIFSHNSGWKIKKFQAPRPRLSYPTDSHQNPYYQLTHQLIDTLQANAMPFFMPQASQWCWKYAPEQSKCLQTPFNQDQMNWAFECDTHHVLNMVTWCTTMYYDMIFYQSSTIINNDNWCIPEGLQNLLKDKI